MRDEYDEAFTEWLTDKDEILRRENGVRVTPDLITKVVYGANFIIFHYNEELKIREIRQIDEPFSFFGFLIDRKTVITEQENDRNL